jgi:dTDP-glucose 4,6-dehydratase
MVRRILRALGKPESLMTPVTDRPGHDRRYALECSKIGRELGWSPRTDLEQGIQGTIAWYRSNCAWLQHVRNGDYQQYYDKYYTHREKSLKTVTA